MSWLRWLSLSLTVVLTAVPAAHSSSIEQLRMDKRFGIGLSAAGPLSMFGIEIDVNVTENFTMTGGIGTGLDYSTVALKGKYFLTGRSVSPYIGAGFARWWTDSVRSKDLSPSVLVKDILPTDFKPQDGFNVFLLYPSVGVQYLHSMGLEFSAEVMYFFRMLSLANAAYGGASVHWYF